MNVNTMSQLIGNTPLLYLGSYSKKEKVELFLKLEFHNPMRSVKDRLALAMIEDAEKKGLLKEGGSVIEATSGNTGIALAFLCGIRGYKLILTMPESMSIERRHILRAFGAELSLTPSREGMTGAVRRAEELCRQNNELLYLRQFENPANPELHRKTTGPEIDKDMNRKVDIFIAGVGTGGTFTGVSQYLKSQNPDVKTIAVEPSESAVLSGSDAGSHKIQGIGAGFVPSILDITLIDEVITVSAEEAVKHTRDLVLYEGVFAGISTGANIAAALRVASRKENRGKRIVTVGCDAGDRYLSTPLYREGQ